MTEPVALNPAALRSLADRARTVGDDLSAVTIPPILAPVGSALDAVQGPGVATAEARRIGTAVQEWAAAARRTVDQLAAADEANAGRLDR